jgi:hypothetical protein
MKKITTILTAALMLFSIFAFANEGEKVSAEVKAAFKKDFSSASAVSWEKSKGYYFATFTINELETNAAYSETGELVATSRTIEFNQVPLSVSLALSKKYPGYTLPKMAMELNYAGITSYFVNVENDRHFLKLRCSGSGDIQVERKLKKQ